MTEKELLKAVRQLARLLGWFTYHTYRSDRSEPGFLDLVLCKPPRLIFAELKSAKGRTSDEQELWISALRRTGATVHLWRPEDWTSGAIEEALR